MAARASAPPGGSGERRPCHTQARAAWEASAGHSPGSRLRDESPGTSPRRRASPPTAPECLEFLPPHDRRGPRPLAPQSPQGDHGALANSFGLYQGSYFFLHLALYRKEESSLG